MINRRFDIHSHMRINSRTVGMTIAVSVLFMFIVGSYAFADVVPSCGTCGGRLWKRTISRYFLYNFSYL